MWPRGRVYSPNTAQTSAATGRGCRGGLAFVRVVACFKPGREAFEGGTLGRVITVPVTVVLFKTKSSKMRRSLFCLLAPSLKNINVVLWCVCVRERVFDCGSEQGDCAFLLNGLASNFNSFWHSDTELLKVKWDWPQLRDSREMGCSGGAYVALCKWLIKPHTYTAL